ncbi:winged helix DNA-binding protein [Herbihabitans rhizosphaerae]|uniref:Winged helix DNA-binding protein n=1 Tax=Herbihabitans rhizosphaerae TaxID=1872711 RepID=A0A4Q7L266_9PSEU|nr:crosslink repair DNA glycosylase YcaQ family protein [Herbihabitans rhizosphaerae]RZS43176.1 winged helix DNA-binding protein [Herbihabitans rhizosphaerae]
MTTAEPAELERARMVAHRSAVQGLTARAPISGVGVLDVGLHDAPASSADIALAVRTGDPRAAEDPSLVRVLSVRGAPHLHRRADLPRLRDALRPRDDRDLLALLGGHGPAFVESTVDTLAMVDEVVELMRARFPGERASKGELSGAISPHLPPPARPWCEGCGSAHVIEGLFRVGTLLAGIEFEWRDRRLSFLPPSTMDSQGGDAALVRAFVHYAGPVHEDDLRTWLVAGAVPQKPPWTPHGWADVRAESEPVRVDGNRLTMAPGALAAAEKAPAPPAALLLAPRDPYLLGHRTLLVPDRALAGQVWRSPVSAGAVLLDGEVAGTWRPRASGSKITLTVQTVHPFPPDVRHDLEEQAQLIAETRGAGAAAVVWE